ncbi:alpha/beta fold hydrolase [Fodinicola acaciae]|uniref:alpha/beta fold hydrolase n=1 Tax=Fodinicola acaciae TaxID=2681555 RepID=UPI0013D283A0|nr:alpha/beta hydrolase [Fodinicola acaciae]
MTESTPTLDGFRAGYVEVAGRRTWHEVAGTGPALVLLHGGFTGAVSWAAQAKPLVDSSFTVRVPERRGHAHTPDVPGPLSYQLMAEDTVAYLDSVVGQPAHLVGWSDGAVVALLVALSRPDLVDRLVLIGQFYNSTGRIADTDIDRFMHSETGKQALRQGYAATSPDGPEHFDVVYEKTLRMIDSEPEIDLAQLAAVTAPTLVMQGDRDIATVQHAVDVATAIPNARLAVLPGTHLLPLESSELVNALLVSFLRDAVPGGMTGH